MDEQKDVVKTTTTVEKEGRKIGWGVLGFFFPVVGLILFLVWLKNKKKASKAAGIGALIGFIIKIILIVLGILGLLGLFPFLNNLMEEDPNNITVQIKKYDIETDIGSYTIKDYRYEADFSEYFWEDTDHTFNVKDGNKKLFAIEESKASGDVKHNLITNSGEKIEIKDHLGVLAGSYDFYYKDNVIIFTTNDDGTNYYFYDLKNNELIQAFTNSEENTKNMFISDIRFEKDSIVFKSFIDGFNGDEAGIIAVKVENGGYDTIEELDAALTAAGLGNFVVSREYTYSKTGGKYSSTPSIKEKTIKELFNSNEPAPVNLTECSVVATKKNSSTSTNKYQKEDEEKYGYTASIDSNCKKINVLSSSNKKLFTIDVESENMKWITIGDHKYCIFNAKSIDFCDYDYAGYIIVEGGGTAPGDGWVDIYNPDTGALTVVNYDAIKSETYDVPMIIDGFHVKDGAIHIYMKIDPNFDRATEEPAKSKLEFVKEIKEKKITDIDQALKDSGYDNFAFSIEVNYKRPGEEPISVVTTKTIKDYFEEINR